MGSSRVGDKTTAKTTKGFTGAKLVTGGKGKGLSGRKGLTGGKSLGFTGGKSLGFTGGKSKGFTGGKSKSKALVGEPAYVGTDCWEFKRDCFCIINARPVGSRSVAGRHAVGIQLDPGTGRLPVGNRSVTGRLPGVLICYLCIMGCRCATGVDL